jgi:glycine dehydrogenase subunit 1
MTPDYVGHGPETERAMLQALGVGSVEELLRAVPASSRMHEAAPIAPGQCEQELRALFASLAALNYDPVSTPSFLGAGLYDHIIPAAIRHILQRSEFATAYTPYQAEVAQGTLATVFEFQSIMAELTGMDVANAGVYDGASASAEAVLLAAGATGRKRVLLSGGLHPHAAEVIATYTRGPGLILETVPLEGGLDDLAALRKALGDDVGAVVLQNPNFFGYIEDLKPLIDAIHAAGAKAIVSANLLSLALLEPPGALGADLVVGEAQCYGHPPQFGGPLCGVFAARSDLLRRLPGRLVAETHDAQGHRGFVLTLQTREQHIRREKATSNICTNSNLVGLGVTLYFTLLGSQGIAEAAGQCVAKAHFLEHELSHLRGVKRVYPAPFFHEFVVELSRPAEEVVDTMLLRDHILAGLDLGRIDPAWKNRLLIAVTEKRTAAEMKRYLKAMERCL